MKVLHCNVEDLKHDFSFVISCSSLDDLLDIAERFPRHIYSFGSLEVETIEEVPL